jgi:hypothetical protein
MTFFAKLTKLWIIGILLIAPFASFAELTEGGDSKDTVSKAPSETLGVKFENPFGNNITSIPQFIGKIVDLLINFGGVVVVFFIVLAGFKFVISQGNPEKLKDAKNMLKWTLIGAVVLLGSKVISEIIQSTLSEFTNIKK